ncbi:MAG: pirin family protein [Pseudomonadota bacterium]
MLTIRKADDRGKADFGWLKSRHTFSFGQYFDADHMGFGPLRVINDDRVAPGGGFSPHGHRDMEIISYVLDGALAHADSIGEGSVIRPGDVQRMTAGTGIRHSEFNESKTDPVHFLQIWIEPEREGLEPSYEQINVPSDEKRGRLRLLGSRNPADGAVTIHQDVALYAGLFDGEERARFDLGEDRSAWVHVAQGEVDIAGERLSAGDAVAVRDTDGFDIANGDKAEILVFDLAA